MGERRGDIHLTPSEINHLFRLLGDNNREGSYYGNRDEYWRRHERIYKKLLVAQNGPNAIRATARTEHTGRTEP